MNLDQIRGVAKIVAGKVQQEAGELLDNPEFYVKGVRKQIAGRKLKGLGDMRQAILDYKERENLPH